MTNNRVHYFSDISNFDENYQTESEESDESNSKTPPPKKKARLSSGYSIWTADENKKFLLCFKKCFAEKRMPKKYEMDKACQNILTRTRAQLRTKVHNILCGKQSLKNMKAN